MLDWLGLTLDRLQLDSATIKSVLDSVYAASYSDAAVLRVLVNDREISWHLLSPFQLGELNAGRPVHFPTIVSRYDLYFKAHHATLKLKLQLGTIADDGQLNVLADATRTIERDDADQPGLQWQIPLGLPGRYVTVENDSEGFRTRLYLQNDFFDPATVSFEHKPKPIDVGISLIDVFAPTENSFLKLRVMRYSARFWAELDGEPVGPIRTRSFGPFPHITPTQLLLITPGKTFPNDEFSRRINVPEGAVIKVELSGKEVGESFMPVGSSDLGTADECFTIDFEEDTPEGDDTLDAHSTSTDYFNFRSMIRTGARPPAPLFEPDGALPRDDDFELTLVAGTTLQYRYGTVLWTTSLRLEWIDGHDPQDEESWQTADTPAISADGTADLLINLAAGTQCRYGIRARNTRGSRSSKVLFLTVT